MGSHFGVKKQNLKQNKIKLKVIFGIKNQNQKQNKIKL